MIDINKDIFLTLFTSSKRSRTYISFALSLPIYKESERGSASVCVCVCVCACVNKIDTLKRNEDTMIDMTKEIFPLFTPPGVDRSELSYVLSPYWSFFSKRISLTSQFETGMDKVQKKFK